MCSKWKLFFKIFFALALSGALVACGPGGGGASTPAPTYTIGGTVSGLSGTRLVVQNNGADAKTISANGAFPFATALVNGASYSVTVKLQPTIPAQTCTITN